MNLTINCTNHDSIPKYQSINLLEKNSFQSEPSIEYINDQLTNTIPKWRLLAETVAMIASGCFTFISSISLAFPPLMVLGFLTFGILNVASYVYYTEHQEKITNLENQISSLFKEYTQEFLFSKEKIVDLITLEGKDFKLIKPYCKNHHPLQYTVREQVHFKLSGGKIGSWSNTPLKLEKICTTTNSKDVIAQYKPWVDLLVELAKYEKVPTHFLNSVSRMAGLEESPLIFAMEQNYPMGHRYLYNESDGLILVTSPTKFLEIRTPLECKEFVKSAFKVTV